MTFCFYNAANEKETNMLRLILGVIAGFIAWLIIWFAGEKLLSTVMPDAFGAPQKAFQDALMNGGKFIADSKLLLMHIVLGTVVSLASGSLAALAAGDNSKAPLIVGILLLVMGILKAVMSWPYVPIWYHIIFTALLLPMAIIGGRLISTN